MNRNIMTACHLLLALLPVAPALAESGATRATLPIEAELHECLTNQDPCPAEKQKYKVSVTWTVEIDTTERDRQLAEWRRQLAELQGKKTALEAQIAAETNAFKKFMLKLQLRDLDDEIASLQNMINSLDPAIESSLKSGTFAYDFIECLTETEAKTICDRYKTGRLLDKMNVPTWMRDLKWIKFVNIECQATLQTKEEKKQKEEECTQAMATALATGTVSIP